MSSPTTPPNAEEIVAAPAVDGDLNAEMRRAAKPFSRTTLVLAGLVVLAIAFGGGAWTHAAFGSPSSSTPTRPAGGTQGTQGGQQGGGFRGAGGRGTTGTVDRVEGTTVYVKTAQGAEVKVSTSDSTTVGVTQQAKLSDLKPGSTVVVQGQAGEDGTVTAQAITQEAAR
ncbi:preprotein translocase subunit YajC [Amycolatopsis lexingtonensis]|uniref:Preprotein translocase subunit YajC n=1 Tax=Amycolatopsis lexingtonensis TaxID=218822 RepID=A0ABR9I7J7_9PSEU|nr:hypothetical protein [Amycolatopsis lexingtonensis]MBE1499135.1 preprotein translocase subunit YajC [Amycolatopsis lexingtonensis]